MIQVPYSPDHNKNTERYPCRRLFQAPCLICGKPVDQGKGHWEVYVHGGGDVLVTEEEYEAINTEPTASAAAMGCYPVGPECAKLPVVRPYLMRARGWR